MNRLGMRLRTLFHHSRGFPFATNLSLTSIPVGLIAVTMGPEVSRAFTIVWHSPTPVYVWGVVLLVGGFNVALGIARPTPSLERAGLGVLAVAYTFYGISVLIGLGQGGLVTGPFFLAMALSCMQRAHIIMRAARTLTAARTVEEAREAAEEIVHVRESEAGWAETVAGQQRIRDHYADEVQGSEYDAASMQSDLRARSRAKDRAKHRATARAKDRARNERTDTGEDAPS